MKDNAEGIDEVADGAVDEIEREANEIEPGLAYVYSWDKFIPFQKGTWAVRYVMKKVAAQAYARDRLLPRVVERLSPSGPLRDRLYDVKHLVDNPLTVTVDDVDRDPAHGPLFTGDEGAVIANLYVPPRVEARQGELPNIERLVRHLTALPDGTPDENAAYWLMTWFAAKAQQPHSTSLTCPVISGPQGSGKTTLVRAFMEILGPANCATISDTTLGGEFNASYAGKLFVFADDVIPKNNMRGLAGKLKTAITGDTVEVNEKNIPRHQMKNRATWLFNANDRNPVSLEPGDRRYSVFRNETPITPEWRHWLRTTFWHPRIQNKPSDLFWREIEAFKYELETAQIDYDLVAKPYENSARESVIEASLGAEESFKRECRERGFEVVLNELQFEAPRPKPVRPGEYKAHDVHRVYSAWAKARLRPQLNDVVVGGCLKAEPDAWPCRKSNGCNVYTVPKSPSTDREVAK